MLLAVAPQTLLNALRIDSLRLTDASFVKADDAPEHVRIECLKLALRYLQSLLKEFRSEEIK